MSDTAVQCQYWSVGVTHGTFFYYYDFLQLTGLQKTQSYKCWVGSGDADRSCAHSSTSGSTRDTTGAFYRTRCTGTATATSARGRGTSCSASCCSTTVQRLSIQDHDADSHCRGDNQFGEEVLCMCNYIYSQAWLAVKEAVYLHNLFMFRRGTLAQL